MRYSYHPILHPSLFYSIVAPRWVSAYSPSYTSLFRKAVRASRTA